MKNCLFVYVLFPCLFLIFAIPARAEWTGAQILTIGALDNVALSKDGTYAVRSSIHLFLVPESDTMLVFGYVGPRFNVGDWLWLSPQLGTAYNWDPTGGDAFLASLWIGITPHTDWFFFLESDLYIYGEGDVDCYGYYSVDYLVGPIGFGPTVEHINLTALFGPHVTWYTKLGPWFSAQYYIAAQDKFTHTVRFVTGLFF